MLGLRTVPVANVCTSRRLLIPISNVTLHSKIGLDGPTVQDHCLNLGDARARSGHSRDIFTHAARRRSLNLVRELKAIKYVSLMWASPSLLIRAVVFVVIVVVVVSRGLGRRAWWVVLVVIVVVGVSVVTVMFARGGRGFTFGVACQDRRSDSMTDQLATVFSSL